MSEAGEKNLRIPQHVKVPSDLSHFWGVTVLSNSPRYKRRYELYHNFAEMIESAGVHLITVELTMGDRPFMITSSMNDRHVQVRSIEELWHKENLVNLGIRRAMELDGDCDKVFWSDCDLRPLRTPRAWIEETYQQLQHFLFVQMFEEFIDLDSNSNTLGGISYSFMGSYFKLFDMSGPMPNAHCREFPAYCRERHAHHRHYHPEWKGNPHSGNKLWFGPPGGAWGANLGGHGNEGGLLSIGMLPDKALLGSGDWHLATCLTGSLNPNDPELVTDPYKEYWFEVQRKCDRWVKRDVGVVRGAVVHDNHGPKTQRNYVGRKKILTDNQYNPHTDVKYDHQGVLQLETYTERQIRFRDQIRHYFRQRNEDQLEFSTRGEKK